MNFSLFIITSQLILEKSISVSESNKIRSLLQFSLYSIFFMGTSVFPMVEYSMAVMATKKIIITKNMQRLCRNFSQQVQSSWVSYKEEEIGKITKTYIKLIVKMMNQNNFMLIPPPKVRLLLTSRGTIKT